MTAPAYKESRRAFLQRNPFVCPRTLGFFYREKMRAIHQIAPDLPFADILEVGGGQSGLTRLLYPRAQVVNLDLDPSFADAPCNSAEGVRFVCGDATALVFPDGSFDAVTMFDLLEHVPEHERAISEAFRVLRPGGWLFVTTPNENWRFPYYRALRRFCPDESEMMAEWGHVRRGYSLAEMRELMGVPCQGHATFITPLTVLCHDVSFCRARHDVRRAICVALAPLTLVGYAVHRPSGRGTERASSWQKPALGVKG